MYFLSTVKYDKVQENGAVKRVSEIYAVEAIGVTDAEAITTEQLQTSISGEFFCNKVSQLKVAEVLYTTSFNHIYMVDLAFINIDEYSGAEKRSKTSILVAADDLEDAILTTKNEMKGTMADWEFMAVKETKIIDVLTAHKN